MEKGHIQPSAAKIRKLQLHKRMSAATVWQVVQAYHAQQMPAKKACLALDISYPRLAVLRRRYREMRGEYRPGWLYERTTSKPKISTNIRKYLTKEFTYIRESSEFFKDNFNFAVLADECQKRYGKRFHRNTIRRWAIKEEFYNPEKDSTGKATIRFETGGVGILFQHDSSIHAWVPATGRNDVLILSMDDHSRKIVAARLVPQDTAWHHLCVVRETIETYGCPLAYYTDNHVIFTQQSDLHTQFSRALSSVDITLKLTAKAHPQAKGKVEKRFDYLQRRIPYLCERYRIQNLSQANRKVLPEVVHHFNDCHIHAETQEIPNRRWHKAIEDRRTFLRPAPSSGKLDIFFGLHYSRYVRNDGTISFSGQFWDVPKAPLRRYVTVVLRPPTSRRRPHTEIFVLYEGSTLAHFVLPGRRGSFLLP
jgi:hypothetical protein